jgi:4-amino-4-deoxy-L-arabinose transferase-like glycosyltransferase
LRSRTRSLWAIVALIAVWLAIRGQRALSARQYAWDGVFFLTVAVVLFWLAISRKNSPPVALWPHNSTGGATPFAPGGDPWSLPRGKGDPTGEHVPAQAEEPEPVPLVPARWRQWLLVATMVLAAIAFASLSKNRFTARGVLCWCGAVATWLLALVEVRPGRRVWKLPSATALKNAMRSGVIIIRTHWVTLALLALLLLAFFFRVYRISTIPSDPESDHVEASKDVWDILQGQYRIFFPRNTGREPTQFYLTALLSKVFGYGWLTLRLTMALVGVLNVIPMYYLGKELLDRRFGVLAAFFVAISYWHVIISRIGLRIVFAPLWTTATLYALLRAFRTRRRNDFLLAGTCLGLGLYGYYAFRIVPLLVIAFCAVKLLVDRGPSFRLGPFAVNVVLLVVTSVLVFLPMMRFMYDEPKTYWYRALTRTTSLEVSAPSNSVAVFADNVKRALLMFNYEGDDAWPESVPLRPALDYVSGGLLVLGAAYLFYLLLIKRNPLAVYLLVAIFILLLPCTLSIAFPNEVPSNLRASSVIPVVLILAALPAYLVGRQVLHAFRGGVGIVLVLLLGGLMLWQAVKLNYETYFSDYREHYRQSAWNATDMAQVIDSFAQLYGGRENAYMICTPYWIDGWGISLVMGQIEWANFICQTSDLEPHLADPRNRLYIYNPINHEAEEWLLTHYPHGQLMRFQAFSPDKDFMIFFAPAQR